MTIGATSQSPPGERILRFDPHRSMGTLWVEPRGAGPGGELCRLAEARFGALVPDGMRVTLVGDRAAAGLGLVPLRGLPADALDGLVLLGCPIDDDDVAHIAGLATVRLLDLYRTAITDAAMPLVGALKHLEWLSLTSTWITDEGLTHLGALSNLRRRRPRPPPGCRNGNGRRRTPQSSAPR